MAGLGVFGVRCLSIFDSIVGVLRLKDGLGASLFLHITSLHFTSLLTLHFFYSFSTSKEPLRHGLGLMDVFLRRIARSNRSYVLLTQLCSLLFSLLDRGAGCGCGGGGVWGLGCVVFGRPTAVWGLGKQIRLGLKVRFIRRYLSKFGGGGKVFKSAACEMLLFCFGLV